MLKVIYDRVGEPEAPSWNHLQTPTWDDELLQNEPWVPHTWSWLAGEQTAQAPAERSLSGEEVARLVGKMEQVGMDEQAALRAAYTLGRGADSDCIAMLLDKLEAAATVLAQQDAELAADTDNEVQATAAPGSGAKIRGGAGGGGGTDQAERQAAAARGIAAESILGSGLAACGTRVAPQLRERIDAAVDKHHKALLLDTLLDTPGSTADPDSIACFGRCIDDDSAWVR